MEETLDAVNDDDELEQEADEEVDKVLYELTDGKLGQAGRVGGELPVRVVICLDRLESQQSVCGSFTDGPLQAGQEEESEDEAEVERMRKEMQQLLS